MLLGTILFFRVCIENKRVHFFFNSDSLCWKPSIPTCLSTFNPEVTLSCFYQWSEWWWQIFSLVFMCGTHLFKKLPTTAGCSCSSLFLKNFPPLSFWHSQISNLDLFSFFFFFLKTSPNHFSLKGTEFWTHLD